MCTGCIYVWLIGGVNCTRKFNVVVVYARAWTFCWVFGKNCPSPRPTTPTSSSRQTPRDETTNTLFQDGSVSINSRPGTLVTHKFDALRSKATGVILRKTAGSPTTLDVLWTNDGVTTINLPTSLKLVEAPAHNDIPDMNSTSSDLDFTQAADASLPSAHASSRGYKPLFSTKLPKDLRHACPLDSVSTTEIENFQIAMDNYLSQGHPRVRLLITGEFKSPLLSHSGYIDFMQDKCSPNDFVFDHAAADEHIQAIRESGNERLARECETLLDNPPYFDGFRP